MQEWICFQLVSLSLGIATDIEYRWRQRICTVLPDMCWQLECYYTLDFRCSLLDLSVHCLSLFLQMYVFRTGKKMDVYPYLRNMTLRYIG